MRTRGGKAYLVHIAEMISPLLFFVMGGLLLAVPVSSRAANTEGVPVVPRPPEAIALVKQSSATNFSDGVSEILRLAEAGVTAEVIKAYAECAVSAVQLTAADVVALKEHKVADEVVLLMLKRGAEARDRATQVRKEVLAAKQDSRLRAGGGFDPEGYDYFQYYYLQPRAMASAYQRLSPYGYHPYAYGYLFRP